ncbi:unnamed protein product, partial [Strongylus vulgaris]
ISSLAPFVTLSGRFGNQISSLAPLVTPSGRFGNQVDQLLGVMQFTRFLNRTLVLPNFIEYPYPNTVMTPFENIFQVAEVKKYQKVVTMVEFTRDIMPKIWPREKRTAFCWAPRKSIYDDKAPAGCHPKEGNPFGPYWDKIGVSFVNDAYFGDIPGGFDLTAKGSKSEWLDKFSAVDFPVLAFPSPPAPFPSKSNTWELQRYVQDSELVETVGKTGARSVFVSSDKDHMIETINEALQAYDVSLSRSYFLIQREKNFSHKVQAYRLNPDDPFVSLAILGKADHFIGNCVSTFSHIVKRERDNRKQPMPTTYFGIRDRSRRLEL